MILGRPGEPWFRKGLQHGETFEGLLREVLATQASVWIETDMRAHLNPRRQAVIRRAAQRLADRLSQYCPACQAPGYGIAHLVSALWPDSAHPPHPPGEFPAIHDFSELLPVG